MTSHAELLRRYARDGDHAAFELIVRRHARLVSCVCGRVAGNLHDAEDATQATFLVLARRAEAVGGANVAGWLSRVAYRCANRIRLERRKRYPADLTEVPAPEVTCNDGGLTDVLDAEMNRLPEKYRVPLVLCYLHGKTYEQAAAELKCPVGTLCGRLARARAMLRIRLVRRGATLGAGGLLAVLDGLGSQTQAAEMTIRSITTAVASSAAGEWIPGRAASVAQGVLRMMTWKSNLLTTALGAMVILCGLGAWAVPADPPIASGTGQAVEVKKGDADLLPGIWIFDAASRGKPEAPAIAVVWESKVTVAGAAICVEGFLGMKVPLKGTLELDTAEKVGHIDLAMEEFDLKDLLDLQLLNRVPWF